MKNLHYFKKIAAILLTVMMVIPTFALPTFAADDTTLTVKGVKAGDVRGYQIVEQKTGNVWGMTDDYGQQKYLKDGAEVTADTEGAVQTWVVKNTVIPYDFENPSDAALQKLAEIARAKGKDNADIEFTQVTQGENKGDYIAEKVDETGSYIVLVFDNTSTTIYNPMLVSVNPDGEGVKSPDTNNTVNAAGSATVYAKSSDIPFDKVVERSNPDSVDRAVSNSNVANNNTKGDSLAENDNASAADGNKDGTNDGNKGDTAGSVGKTDSGITFVGDVVWFRINTRVPEFTDEYFATGLNNRPEFNVYDTLSTGLNYNSDSLSVKAKVKNDKDEDVWEVITSDYATVSQPTGKTFKVAFTEDGLKKYAGKYIELCYSATVNENHKMNFSPETNTAYPEYTRAPGETVKEGEKITTYHYTFGINANVQANAKTENREVIKIGLDDSENFVWKETGTWEETGWHPLDGVTFDLKDASGNVVKKVSTDAEGILRGMEILDAGVYTLVETGLGTHSEYALNTTPITVRIDSELDDKGRLIAYTVKVGDGENLITVGDYTKEYSGDDDTGTVYFWKVVEGERTKIASMDKEGKLTDIGEAARHSVEYKYKDGEEEKTKTWDDTDGEAADIINTTVGTLPSTGGMGTVLFTVGGIAIMALALFLLFGGKKKEEQK